MSRVYGVATPFVGDNANWRKGRRRSRKAALVLTTIVLPVMAGCTTNEMGAGGIKPQAAAKPESGSKVAGKPDAPSFKKVAAAVPADETQRNCLVRAMYFESNRSSTDGLLAVGSVVMNRVKSPAFPDTICSVVGQPRQFAPGVMTRRMASSTLPEIEQVADEVVHGARHPKVGSAMFFHTAGLHFPYRNMHYVTVAGGNAFYVKTGRYADYSVASADSSAGAAPTEMAAVTTPSAVPVPETRPDDGLPGVSTAFASQSNIDQRVNTAFAAATN